MGYITNPRIDTRTMESAARSMGREQARRNAQGRAAAASGGCLLTLLMLPLWPLLALTRGLFSRTARERRGRS